MAAAGFKGTVSLTVDETGARLTDSVTGHTVEVTQLEGMVLELFVGQGADVLAKQAQAKGIGLWPDQVRVVLERVGAHGFLAQPLAPEATVGPSMTASDVVPRFRSDLALSKAPASRSVIQVVDPVTLQAFSLFDFEASIARMLNGSRTVSEVIDLAAKIGIPVTVESLDRFVRQLRSFGFLDSMASAAPPTAWDPRDAWSPEVRELFQAALRLMRTNNPQQALNYIDAILQTNPDLPEALDLRTRAEAAFAGTLDLTLPFNELHGGPGRAAAAPPLPPPPPDETTAEHQAVAPPPAVARVEGLGLLPPPRVGPAPAAPSLRSTQLYGSDPETPSAPPHRPTLVFGGEQPQRSPPVLTPSAVPSEPPHRPTLVFGAEKPGSGESASGPRQFNSVLFGASSGVNHIGSEPVAATEPHQVVSQPPVRKQAPPRASPPPRGAEVLSEPLGGSQPNVPTVDAEVANVPLPEERAASVQVDAMAWVPQGSTIEVDPSLTEGGAGFSASDADAPPPHWVPTPAELQSNPSPASLAETPVEPTYNVGQNPQPVASAQTPVVPSRRGKALPLVAALVTLIAGAMAIPVPRTVDVACAVGPVVLAEPHAAAEGRVTELVVKAGDVVAAGTVLARLEVPDPPAAAELAEKAAAARAKLAKLKATVAGSPKAKKANAALVKADKELVKAKAALAKVEAKKNAADKAKAKKALDARQKARDKAQAAADIENGAKKMAEFEAEAAAAVEERERVLKEAPGTTITAPIAGRFEPTVKAAVGMELAADERFGRIVDPGLWKVTASELPVATEPSTAKIKLETGRIVDLTGATLSGEGPTRELEGTALLTDDATGAGKTVLQVRAGKRPLAVMLLALVKARLR